MTDMSAKDNKEDTKKGGGIYRMLSDPKTTFENDGDRQRIKNTQNNRFARVREMKGVFTHNAVLKWHVLLCLEHLLN